jgi:ribosomal protein S27AE
MILLFGTKTFTWGHATTDYIRSCPRCGYFGHLTRRRQLRTIALFFLIPLIPLGKPVTVDICPRCGLELSSHE